MITRIAYARKLAAMLAGSEPISAVCPIGKGDHRSKHCRDFVKAHEQTICDLYLNLKPKEYGWVNGTSVLACPCSKLKESEARRVATQWLETHYPSLINGHHAHHRGKEKLL